MSSLPFFTEQAEAQLVEQIGTMQASGVCLGYDPSTASAAYVLVRVERGQKPQMHRWTVEGPVTLDHARQTVQEIAAAAELDGLVSEPQGGLSIN